MNVRSDHRVAGKCWGGRCSRFRAFAPSHLDRFPSGLTLVEMLVATAVTLLLVLAVTRSFAVVAEIVSVNRATLEMAGQLRGATLRLQRDLDGLTAPVQPWLDSHMGLGYFEYVEGWGTDTAPAMHRVGVAAPGVLPTNSYLGDVDDVIMFTAHGLDEPFVGNLWQYKLDVDGQLNWISEPIVSKTAEIVWWTVLQDANRNEVWDPGETFTLHRRALLIRPDLNDPETGRLDLTKIGRLTLDTNQNYLTPQILNLFYNNNDLSVRPVVGRGGTILGFAANSLGDLTLRQHRFAHYPVSGTDPPRFLSMPRGRPVFDPRAFPYELDLRPSSPTSLLNMVQWGTGSDDLLQNQIGHDIVLSNVLAFDVRAFDVTAPVDIHRGLDAQWGVAGVNDDNTGGTDDVQESGWPGSDDEPLTPGDPGWVLQPVAGRGAYVDLHYPRDGISQANPISQFSNPPAYVDRNNNQVLDIGEAHLSYDTWPFDFERDGFNQDLDGSPNATLFTGLIDEGLNGRDDPGFAGLFTGGVDDYSERETRPPYNVRLRGIQVRLRLIDPDTRQVRQQSVRSDFTPD